MPVGDCSPAGHNSRVVAPYMSLRQRARELVESGSWVGLESLCCPTPSCNQSRASPAASVCAEARARQAVSAAPEALLGEADGRHRDVCVSCGARECAGEKLGRCGVVWMRQNDER